MASEKGGRPLFIEHKITHYRQRFNWDCGVSCVLMLLEEEQRRELLNRFAETCQEEGFNQSTWTIDLCYLLKRYGIRHQMCTIMPGVNEDYKKHGYYDRILDLDRERVRRRFDEAAGTGIEVSQRSLSTDELVAHLVSSGPVVLLVDAGLLVCDLTSTSVTKLACCTGTRRYRRAGKHPGPTTMPCEMQAIVRITKILKSISLHVHAMCVPMNMNIFSLITLLSKRSIINYKINKLSS